MKTKPIIPSKLSKKEIEELTETVRELIIVLYDSRAVSDLKLIEKHAVSCLLRLQNKKEK